MLYPSTMGAPFSQFFCLFEANLSEHGSYSLHVRMFRYIHKHLLFTSFASYRFEIFAQTRIQIFDLMQNKCMSKQIYASERIFASYCRLMVVNVHCLRLEANIRKFHISHSHSLAIFAYKQVFAYFHTSEYSLRFASNLIGKPFTNLRPQLIFRSFWNTLSEKNICFRYNSFCMHPFIRFVRTISKVAVIIEENDKGCLHKIWH
jgi:hypothetical protein